MGRPVHRTACRIASMAHEAASYTHVTPLLHAYRYNRLKLNPHGATKHRIARGPRAGQNCMAWGTKLLLLLLWGSDTTPGDRSTHH